MENTNNYAVPVVKLTEIFKDNNLYGNEPKFCKKHTCVYFMLACPACVRENDNIQKVIEEIKYAIEDIPDIKDLTNHKADLRVIENLEDSVKLLGG